MNQSLLIAMDGEKYGFFLYRAIGLEHLSSELQLSAVVADSHPG